MEFNYSDSSWESIANWFSANRASHIDLAFFHDEEDKIIHVGIILKDNHIIHASGKVRIDRLDQTGIYNNELNTHTHKLRFIKKII